MRGPVADVAPGPLTPLSATLGPASVLTGAVCPRVSVTIHSGHPYLELVDAAEPAPGLPDPATERAADRAASRAREVRPDLKNCPDAELASRVLALRDPMGAVLPLLVAAQVALDDAVRDHPAELGRTGGRASELDPADQLWQLARVITRSAALTAIFDEGGPGLAPRLAASRIADVVAFRQGLVATLAEFAHVSSGGWELAVPGWLSAPGDLLRLLDVLRRTPDLPAPDPSTEPAADVAAAYGARRRAANRVDLVAHEQRLLLHELARRAAADGTLVDVADLFGLRTEELPGFVAKPARYTEDLRLRSYDHCALASYVPPRRGDEPPGPAVRWRRAGGVEELAPGAELAGVAVAPGRASGIAAVLTGPDDAERLTPGRVLVVATAGQFWVPLLRAAAALVVDAGTATSPAAVACRRLGLPCLVDTGDATERVAAGTPVTVDADVGVLAAG